MATLIRAIATYRPRILSRRTVGPDELAERITRDGIARPSIANLVLARLADEIEACLLRGEAVELPGVGRIGVDIRLDGRVRPVHRADPELRRRLARPGAFEGIVLRSESIGQDVDEIIARWNREHPDDPVRRTGDTVRPGEGGG